MKISRIHITNHRLPLDPGFFAAWDPRPRARFDATIVRVDTDEGLVGIGSGGSMPGFAGHEDLFVGADPLALDRHFRVIENLSFHYGRCWPLEEARAVAERLEGCDLRWIEEPLWRGDWEGLRALRGATRPPIAGGELTRELHELRELVTRGCLDVVQPDAVLVGGLGGLSRIARLSADHGLVFTPHTWGNGIGLLANAQLAASVGSPILEFPFDPPGWTPERRDFPLARPVEVDGEGWLVLPEAPGLGIELDEERLRATRV
jgi:L-alanine-DL-glutamate epimerase-like enolase superfamily enzyme